RSTHSPSAALRDPVLDRAVLDASWRTIGARRALRQGSRRALLVAPLVLTALIVLVLAFRPSRLQPIALGGGSPPPMAWTASPALTVALDDGSWLELAPRARLRSVPSTPSRVELVLDEGSATFDVKPGGPRAWIIDAGNGTFVRVVGTRFT